MKKLIKQLAVAVAVMGCVATGYAVPNTATVRLSNDGGTTWTTITDNLPGDINATPGAVTFSGTIGNWIVNVTTGVTFPVLGTITRPTLDLNSVNVTSASGGSLIIEFSDIGFGPTVGNAQASIGGTTSGSVTWSTYGGPGNSLFQGSPNGPVGGVVLTAPQVFGPVAFSSSVPGGSLGALGSPYSLTERVVITHAGAGGSSFNAELTVPDGGATLLLLGSSIMALGLFRRSFGRKA